MDNVNVAEEFLGNLSERPVYSVSLISRALKDVVEGNFSNIRIQGEIQGLKRHTSGHIYFALKDSDAVMDAVCWRGTPHHALLREGLEIIALGKITTYPGRSKYQMIISSFEASGEGALLQILHQLKQKLASEGLFDPRYKKTLPLFPKRIGLITSKTGAVLQDILHRLQDRYPCSVLLYPVAVQGDGAADQVRKAVKYMNTLEPNHRPDVLIIARGGGSLEDLFAFNDEALVREVFASKIPVISAIGHETDFTMLDFVADLRAPTPTAAAELSTPVLSHIFTRLVEIERRFTQGMRRYQELLSHKIARCESVLKNPLQPLFERQQRLDDWAERMHMGIHRLFVQKRLFVGNIKVPTPQLSLKISALTQLSHRLIQQATPIIEKRQVHLDFLHRQLEGVSFKKTLARGFCVAQNAQGAVIDSLTKLPKTSFSLHFYDGIATVESLLPAKKQGVLF